jgi:hypothetical protein
MGSGRCESVKHNNEAMRRRENQDKILEVQLSYVQPTQQRAGLGEDEGTN